MALLVDWQIREYIKKGDIVISPFNKDQLNTVSYDVRLGEWFCRAKAVKEKSQIFNPMSQKSINARWGEPQKAEIASKTKGLTNSQIKEHEIEPNRQVILLGPGELILGHTEEFIGGVERSTGAMNARSTAGRDGFSVCMCAGWGDVGYFSRWTMEIHNNTNDFTIALSVGARIAQIHIFGVEKPDGLYSKGGHYQNTNDLETLKKNWDPMSMLPRPLDKAM